MNKWMKKDFPLYVRQQWPWDAWPDVVQEEITEAAVQTVGA